MKRAHLLLAAAIGAAPALTGAQPARKPESERAGAWTPLRWGVGLEIAPFVSPGAHVGAPLGADGHLPLALSLRWEHTRHTAVSGGLGGAPADTGLSLWTGYEVFNTVVAFRGGLVELGLYATPGLQLGFAGPGYFARHSGVFVGFDYIYSGPLVFASRLPLGLRLRFLHHRLDTYLEATTTLTFTPSVELLTGVTTGVRVNF